MATTYGVGCKNIKIGPVAVDGDMGTALVDAGKPFKGTVNISDEDGTIAKFFGENSRYPFLAVNDAGGTQVKFTLTDLDPANVVKWLGGTAVTTTWNAPVVSFSSEQSFSADTIFGTTIKIVRLFLYCKLTWNMTRTEIAKLEITGEVMEPVKAGVAPMTLAPTV